MSAGFETVIGLEVHVELATKSKMFCSCSAEHFQVTPNTHTCPVCLGLPGALPVPNRKAVEWTIMLGLALGCRINENSKFDRKNYFYPDLSKGYQISQYDEPFCYEGNIRLSNGREIKIRRVHLEEDTGKLAHTEINGEKVTLVDFNRSGVPLVEIVTEPDFRTIEEVDEYLKKLQKVIRYLGISSADMEKGSMRLEPSISLRKTGEKELPSYRVELKNINSFRFARRALEYEINRQAELLSKGEKVIQQTRGWSETQNATVPQRDKEEANDYRYFPEPDIPPVLISAEWKTEIEKQLVELPDAKSERFQKEYKLSGYDAEVLTVDKTTAEKFEQAVSTINPSDTITVKDIANAIINRRVDINGDIKKQIAEGKKTEEVTDAELETMVNKAFDENPKSVESLKAGKEQSINVLIGEVMRQKRTDPEIVKAKIKELLIK